MSHRWKRWLAMLCIASCAWPALAQSYDDALVVNGSDWMRASKTERQAFLVGVANMIMAEGAYAKKNKQPTPPVSAQIIAATQTAKIGDIEERITRWYEANPGKSSTPVMVVVWQDIVKAKR